jgi:RNA polymerase sigma-70 factor (ECF subfamily)
MNWLPKLLASRPAVTDEQAMHDLQTGGNHDAFALLVERWQTPIRRLCARMTGNEHRGEDLAQEAFARVFAKRHQFARGSRFSTWLWRIALNLCFEEGRRTARRGERPLDPDAESNSQLLACGPSPDEQTLGQERAAMVRAALAQLSETHRSIVVLREYEGLKYREIAEVLAIPEGTVKWRMAEALSQLSELLEPLAPGDQQGTSQTAKSLNKT